MTECQDRLPQRRRIGCGGCAVTFFLVLLVAFCAFRYAVWWRAEHFPSDSGPRDLFELNAFYVEPPQGENAADVYVQAFDQISIPCEVLPNCLNLPRRFPMK